MSRTLVTQIVLAVMIGTSFLASASTAGASDFESDLRALRLEMVSMCKQLQMGAPSDSREQLLGEIDGIIGGWQTMTERYRSHPPKQYAEDPAWASYFGLAADNMAIMRAKVEAGHYKRAAMFCGQNCGLFVMIHEVNGLVTPADRMFHIRKSLKMAASMAKAGNWHGAQGLLDQNARALEKLKEFPVPDAAAYIADLKKIDAAFTQLRNAGAKKDGQDFEIAFRGFLTVFAQVYVHYL